MPQNLLSSRNEAYTTGQLPLLREWLLFCKCLYASISHDISHQRARTYCKARTAAITRMIDLEAMTKQQGLFSVIAF